MSKIIDITDKLNFEEKPKLKIKGVEVEVNNSATAMLKILPLMKDGATSDDLLVVCNQLFDKENFEKIESLDLSFTDFQTLLFTAIELVADNSDEGETQTPATT